MHIYYSLQKKLYSSSTFLEPFKKKKKLRFAHNAGACPSCLWLKVAESGLAPWASQPFSAEAHTTLCSIRFTPKDNFPFKDSFPFTSLAVLWSVGRILKENPHNTGRICKLVHAKHP